MNDEINYDLLTTIHGIQLGNITCPELLGHTLGVNSKTQDNIPNSVAKAYCGGDKC